MIQSLTEWFATPLGSYLLEREQRYFDEAVADIFGFNAMQIGMSSVEFLRANRMPLRFVSGWSGAVQLRSDARYLPFESNSLDLVLLPHVLEFSAQPHHILREVERVVRPEGQVIICGFNPWSLWGARRYLAPSTEPPWSGDFISLFRLKDWLALLGFDITGGKLDGYAPPFNQQKWLRRCNFMDAAGDRWWPIAGGVYFLQATKRVTGMKLILPSWSDKSAASKGMVPSAQELSQDVSVEQ